MEPTRVVAYKGYEIRFFVRAPVFSERYHSASFDVRNRRCKEDADHFGGSVAGPFITSDDAELAALKAPTRAVDERLAG